MADEVPAARAATPTTAAELKRSIRILRVAVGGAVTLIVAMTVVFVVALDAPAVPLVPIAALVTVIDIGFLINVTRQRRRALEEIRRREAGAV